MNVIIHSAFSCIFRNKFITIYFYVATNRKANRWNEECYWFYQFLLFFINSSFRCVWQFSAITIRGSIQNVAWMKCKAKYVKPPVHRWLTNVTQYIWEENKKFRSFYFASVASIFIPVDYAVNKGNNEKQIEKMKKRLYVTSVLGLK